MSYWQGTVLCPRKGLSHITREACLELASDQGCGSCRAHVYASREIAKEKRAEADRKAACKTLGSRRGSSN
jgi:hypothetical protein